MNFFEFLLFAFLLFTANKTNLFVHFLGESTLGPNCFWFYLTFTELYNSRTISLKTVTININFVYFPLAYSISMSFFLCQCLTQFGYLEIAYLKFKRRGMKNWQILELWSPPSFWDEIWDVGDQLTSKDLFYFFLQSWFHNSMD